MAVVDSFNFVPLFEFDDPDDYRTQSRIAISTDPGSKAGRVENMVVFREYIGVGEAIPIHKHSGEEIMIIEEGQVLARLNDEQHLVKAGGIVYIPAKAIHGFENTGDTPAKILAVFPSRHVDIQYLGRNPAPGTEGQQPQPPFRLDIRALTEGDFEGAMKPADPADFL